MGRKWRECDFWENEELKGILEGGENNEVFKWLRGINWCGGDVMNYYYWCWGGDKEKKNRDDYYGNWS